MMKILKIKSAGIEHTWDVSTKDEQYTLGNGCISHNTSAKVSGRGTTNGLEPIKDYIVSKGGKSSKGKFVAPELDSLKGKYDLVWTWQGCQQLIRVYAIIQKYMDQSISCNTYYAKNNFPGNQIPGEVVLKDIYDAHRFGLKSLYYHNNNDDNEALFSAGDVDKQRSPKIQEASIEEDEGYCEACTL